MYELSSLLASYKLRLNDLENEISDIDSILDEHLSNRKNLINLIDLLESEVKKCQQ